MEESGATRNTPRRVFPTLVSRPISANTGLFHTKFWSYTISKQRANHLRKRHALRCSRYRPSRCVGASRTTTCCPLPRAQVPARRCPVLDQQSVLPSAPHASHTLRPGRKETELTSAARYSIDHEWVEFDDQSNVGTVGITEYAQKALGDVVFVELPSEGETVAQGGESLPSLRDVGGRQGLMSDRCDRSGRVGQGGL